MSIFPKAKLSILVPGGVLPAGEHVEATLVIEAPEPIPRTLGFDLHLRSTAWAGYGSGKNRSVIRRDLYSIPMRSAFDRGTELAAGTHRIPFELDVPAWLSPSYDGTDCGIATVIDARVDVDWAVDPKITVAPPIVRAPLSGMRTPGRIRSGPDFHSKVALELALDSTVIAHDEMLRGQIALRSTEPVTFSAVVITMRSVATISMGRGDRRTGAGMSLRITPAELEGGKTVPFAIRASDVGPASFRNRYLEHDLVLDVSLDVPWGFDPSFRVPLQVLPPGSSIASAGASEVSVGHERLMRLAETMATESGLAKGDLPTLVCGQSKATGAVVVFVDDSPRQARLGLDIDFTFPDVDLGFRFHRRGMLDVMRAAPLLPEGHRGHYYLTIERPEGKPPLPESVIADFLATLVGDVDQEVELRVDEHHLGLHLPLVDDDPQRMIGLARFARAKVDRIATAIAALPFPEGLEDLAAAWSAAASARRAYLVPSGPAIHGIVLRSRVVGGEERSVTAAIRTVWTSEGPLTRVDVDLEETPIPKTALDTFATQHTSSLDGVFPRRSTPDAESAVLEHDALTRDPRELMPALDQFFALLLEARGERRAESAYR